MKIFSLQGFKKVQSSLSLQKILPSYKRYYNVTENLESSLLAEHFAATAEFHSEEEQYFLVKSAKMSSSESNEYVYFATLDSLSEEKLNELAKLAWNDGLSKVKPFYGQKNSDVILIILADNVDENVLKAARKIKFYKSYKFSFYGWSNFGLAVFSCTAKKFEGNRKGRDLKKMFKNL